jgi:hypothetical protein
MCGMAQDLTPLFFNTKRKHTEEGTNSMTKTQASTWISSAGKKNSQDYGNPD